MPFDVDLDTGFRQGAFDIAASYYMTPYVGVEAQFIDEGKQPDNIPNINRPVNMDLKLQYPIDRFVVTVKGGVTSSYFSHNGSGNGYKNNTGFTGGNGGLELSYQINNHWAINSQFVTMSYQQSDITAFETFTYGSVGIKYKF